MFVSFHKGESHAILDTNAKDRAQAVECKFSQFQLVNMKLDLIGLSAVFFLKNDFLINFL